jgi:flagellar hook protein FlgE
MKIKTAPGPKNKVTFKTNLNADASTLAKWWDEANSDTAANQMLTSAAFLKESQAYRYRQAAVYARLYGNQSLYNFAGSNIGKMDQSQGLPQERPTFNLIQSATDTLVSRISQNRPQPVFLTDNGDYKQRTLAKKLNNFVGGEFFRCKTYELATIALRDALVEGDGLIHVFETQDNRVGMERVLLTELLVDPNEAMYGEPRRLYRMKLIDREVLLANFPKLSKKIADAAKATPDNSANASKSVADLVMVVESWSLPSIKGAKDGRHMLACSAGCLIDEEYTKDRFPFSRISYSPRLLGYWSQGIEEQLMGTQIELNSILYTISRAIKLVGVPRVFQEDSSKVVSAHHSNEVGVIVKYRGTKPSYEVAPCNAPELYAERDKLIQYGYQQCGVSALQASSQKPQGLNSGEAIRSYDDISTDRFASLARRYDNFFIDLAYLIVDQAKDICDREGKYSTVYPNKDGTKQIDLKSADMVEDSFVIQCFTQSALPKDPAGRLAKVTEMITSGMISIQEGRRLLDYPDLEQIEKLANAGEERIFQMLDLIIEKGKYTPPDTFMDLALAETLTTQYINLYTAANLEEEKAQMLRDFFGQIQDIKQAAQPPPPPTPEMPAAGVPEASVLPPPPQVGVNSAPAA